MKRNLTVVLLCLLAAALLVGCGRTVPAGPEGKYVIKTIDGRPVEEALRETVAQYGDGMILEDLIRSLGLSSVEEYITIELKSGGEAAMDVAGMGVTNGTWTLDGDKLSIDMDGSVSEFTRNGDELSYQKDAQDYVFIRK